MSAAEAAAPADEGDAGAGADEPDNVVDALDSAVDAGADAAVGRAAAPARGGDDASPPAADAATRFTAAFAAATL
jgi:hypothetical protein